MSKGRSSVLMVVLLPVLVAAASGEGETWPPTLTNSIGMQFVLIPAGEFRMGLSGPDADTDEQPVHRVIIPRPFYLGRYEVTQGQWQTVMGNHPSRFVGHPGRPVEQVSWEDVRAFIQRLNAREGAGLYRLPSEAEWEYAARAGSTTAYSFGGDWRSLGAYGWYADNAGGRTHPVGQLQPNPWGLHDMHGNVWEWVQDWYGGYTAGTLTDPQGPASGTARVVRGGSWPYHARFCRSAYRYGLDPSYRFDSIGLRLVRTAP